MSNNQKDLTNIDKQAQVAPPEWPIPDKALLNNVANKIIEKKLQQVGVVTEIDQWIHEIKKWIQDSPSIEIAQEKSIWQIVDDFFSSQKDNTLDQLDANKQNQTWILATDLWIYSCMVSVIDHIMTQILAKNPSITQADMNKAVNTIVQAIQTPWQLQAILANPPMINHIAITGPIELEDDEKIILHHILGGSKLAKDFGDAHGSTPSHYAQVLSLVDQGIKTKVKEHYDIATKAKKTIWQRGDEIATTASWVSTSISQTAWQAWERGKQNKNTLGAVALGWVAVYGLYKFVNWMSSDDAPEMIAEDDETGIDNKTYNTHMKKGYALWKKKKYIEAKKEFEKASLLDVSDGQAQKRIDKCESKTGTTWSWKSKLWTFLKWAATIWIVWWSAYALYKWRNGEGKDSKPDIPSAVDDITTQIKKFESLSAQDQQYYNDIGTSINKTYSQIHTFPEDIQKGITANSDPLWAAHELVLGTGSDKHVWVIPYTFEWYEHIWQIIHADQVWKMIAHADINQLEELCKDLIAQWMDFVLWWIAQAVGFDFITQGVKGFIDWIKEGNNAQTIKAVSRKIIKSMSWLQMVQRYHVGIQLEKEFEANPCTITYDGQTIPKPNTAQQQISLINMMLSDPLSYSINGKEISTYIQWFESQSIKQLDIEKIKTLPHGELMKYNTDIQTGIEKINEDRNTIQQKLKTEWSEQTIDFLINNLGKDIGNSMIDGIWLWISQQWNSLYEYLPFANVLSGLKAGFSRDRQAIVEELMHSAGYQEIVAQYKNTLVWLKWKSPNEVSQGIDEYFAMLKELQTAHNVLIDIQKSETSGTYTVSLINAGKSFANTTYAQIVGWIEMMFDPDNNIWTRVKWSAKLFAWAAIPAILFKPTRMLYINTLKWIGKTIKWAGSKLLQSTSSSLSRIPNPRQPASIKQSQIKAVTWINDTLNTHPRFFDVVKNAHKFKNYDNHIATGIANNTIESNVFKKLGDIISKDPWLKTALSKCTSIDEISNILNTSQKIGLSTKEIQHIQAWLKSISSSHSGDDIVKLIDHIWHFPLKDQMRWWMKIPGMAILNWPIAQFVLKIAWVAWWALEALQTRQSYRSSEKEIKAMKTENEQLAKIMENEQFANLIAWGTSTWLAIASAIVWWPAWLIILAWYVGMQGFKAWVDTYYDVMKFYNLNTANYLKQHTWFIKSAIVSAQSRNANVDVGFKDQFQSLVSQLPLWTEDFHGLNKANKANRTSREALIALITIDEMMRRPDIETEKLNANIWIRIQYIDQQYPKGVQIDASKDVTKVFDSIDTMIMESRLHQLSKSPDFNCDIKDVEQKYKDKLDDICEWWVDRLEGYYQKNPLELYRMYALCQSPYFDTLVSSKTNPDTQKTLQQNKQYLIDYRKYKTLKINMEDLPTTMLTQTEDIVQLEQFLLYNFDSIKKNTYTKQEAISMLQNKQYLWYDLQTNACIYGSSGVPWQDLLYQYARYLWYGISSDPQGSLWTNTLEGLKKFFERQEWKDDGMSNQDQKGIYRYPQKNKRWIQQLGRDHMFEDEVLKDVSYINQIILQSGNMIDTSTGTAENRVNSAYSTKLEQLGREIIKMYWSKQNIKTTIHNYIKSAVKNDGSQYIELPSDLIQQAIQSWCGNVQPYLYTCIGNQIHGLVSNQHFVNTDRNNIMNELIGNNYELVDTKNTNGVVA